MRVALLESGQVSEVYVERRKDKSLVGNIYKGRVIRVLPGMQAAFVDIGLERAAFLYVADVADPAGASHATLDGPAATATMSDARAELGQRPIQSLLHEGQVVVGVTMAVATVAFEMQRFDVTYWGKLATFLLMGAVPAFMVGADSGFPGHEFFLVLGYAVGIPGLALSYWTALAYAPTIRDNVRAGRAARR